MKIGVQLYTVRNFLSTREEVISTLKKIKKIGYDNIQACCPMKAVSYKELGEIASGLNLEICGTFDSLSEMLSDTEKFAENTKHLGTGMTGVGYAEMSDKQGVLDVVAQLNAAREKLAPHNIKVCYHNHNQEFSKIDGKIILDYIIENTDVDICLDTYWTQLGGGDVRHYIKKLSGRLDILHLKDYRCVDKKALFAAIGDGNLYWDGIISEAKAAGVKYYVVEQDDCYGEDPFDALARSREYLEKYR